MLTALLPLLLAAGVQLQPLFELGRTKNANVVVYSVRLDSGGNPDAKEPLEAHWVMKATDGRTQPLTDVERKLAYGFKVAAAGPGRWTISLNALRDRPFTLIKLSAGWRAVLRVGGETSVLDRVFVDETEKLDVPEVKSVELYGESVGDGSATHEQLTRKKKQRREASEEPF